jgi:hypothetical protein
VPESYDKTAAVVVLPPITAVRLRDASLRAWLARSDLSAAETSPTLLQRITSALRLPCPEDGHAALRMWGQTGDRPGGWIAAADPVYLEPQLDRLCLHALPSASISSDELGDLIEHLQSSLAGDKRYGFVRIGDCGYVSAQVPFATAAVPSSVVDQQSPAQFMPTGARAAGFRGLLSEIEMALHEHDVNQRRVAAGRQPINSLWLWGGGTAPAESPRSLPPLFANDSLLRGYWESAAADATRWPGTIAGCIEAAPGGFVAVTPQRQNDADFLETCLQALRAALRSGRLSSLTLLFRDGVAAGVSPSQAYRFWRRDAALLRGARE